MLPISVSERLRSEPGAQARDQIENGADRGGQHDHLTAANGVGGIGVTSVDRSLLARPFENRGAIAAHDTAEEAVFLQRQT